MEAPSLPFCTTCTTSVNTLPPRPRCWTSATLRRGLADSAKSLFDVQADAPVFDGQFSSVFRARRRLGPPPKKDEKDPKGEKSKQANDGEEKDEKGGNKSSSDRLIVKQICLYADRRQRNLGLDQRVFEQRSQFVQDVISNELAVIEWLSECDHHQQPHKKEKKRQHPCFNVPLYSFSDRAGICTYLCFPEYGIQGRTATRDLLEYCDLLERGGLGFGEEEQLLPFHRLMGDLLEAVHFLHEHGVAHRDLKPDNVAVVYDANWPYSYQSLYLIDLGYAVQLPKTALECPDYMRQLSDRFGTINYLPPEFFLNFAAGEMDVGPFGPGTIGAIPFAEEKEKAALPALLVSPPSPPPPSCCSETSSSFSSAFSSASSWYYTYHSTSVNSSSNSNSNILKGSTGIITSVKLSSGKQLKCEGLCLVAEPDALPIYLPYKLDVWAIGTIAFFMLRAQDMLEAFSKPHRIYDLLVLQLRAEDGDREKRRAARAVRVQEMNESLLSCYPVVFFPQLVSDSPPSPPAFSSSFSSSSFSSSSFKSSSSSSSSSDSPALSSSSNSRRDHSGGAAAIENPFNKTQTSSGETRCGLRHLMNNVLQQTVSWRPTQRATMAKLVREWPKVPH